MANFSLTAAGSLSLTAVGDKHRRYLCDSKLSPTKVGSGVFRRQLRTKARSMVCFWLLFQLHAKPRSMRRGLMLSRKR